MNLYLIPNRKGRYVLSSPLDAIKTIEAGCGDRVRQFIRYLVGHSNPIVAWVGRVMRAGHGYYVDLEHKIDPAERVLKAMSGMKLFVVHYPQPLSEMAARSEFERILRRQRFKHLFWLCMDLIISPLGVLLTPIPGPNLFFYYPFLRLLSHYRAMSGTTSGLRSSQIDFKSLLGPSRVEDNLSGLATYLERTD